ncbi:DUF4173 domain-containing protein [Paenibacillus rigui]|nr:DUF4173 domain-containing protein [Paenibacillus rigui]
MMTTQMLQRSGPLKQELALLAAAMAGGYIHQLFFYGKDWGVSYPLFVLLFYVYFYWGIRERHELKFGAELLFLVPIALLSLTYAGFSNLLFKVLNALAVPFLIVVHTTWTVRKHDIKWFDPAIVPAVLEQVFVHTLRYVPLPVQTVFRAVSGRMKQRRSQKAWKVLAGIIISLPILLLVVSLLASADAIFEKTVSKLPEWLGELELGSILFRTVWIAVVGSGMFIYVWGLLHPKPKGAPASYWEANQADFERRFGSRDASGQEIDITGRGSVTTPESVAEFVSFGPAPAAPGGGAIPVLPAAVTAPVRTRLDPTIMTTVLTMLVAVYVLFAVVQFSYFFGSGAGLLPEGVTYAEYARRGFAELVIVTIINFTVLMITLYGVDRTPQGERHSPIGTPAKSPLEPSTPADAPSSAATGQGSHRLLTGLLFMLIGCTGIMLCSAYLRLSLYEMAYGYTITRVLVHSFMIFLLALFIIALIKLMNDKLHLLKLYLITSVVAYVLLNYVQVDAIIAANNMDRYEQTGQIDTAYLQSLSFEAVPYLIELQQKHPEVEGTRHSLQVMKQRLGSQQDKAWMEFNVSEWRAARAMQTIEVQEEPREH